MCALGEKRDEHHQIGQRKEPIVGLAGGFRGAGDKAQVARAGELMNVLEADASQAGNFRIGEDFLTRFYCDHGRSPQQPVPNYLCDSTLKIVTASCPLFPLATSTMLRRA